MPMQQLALPLPFRSAYGREDFLVTEANKQAVAWIDAFPNWSHHFLLIYGQNGCGKTHLAHVFCDTILTNADITEENIPNLPDKFVLEDVENGADERVLFHLYNYTMQQNKYILLTAPKIPHWKLPDLKTRMSTIPSIPIHQPDDLLMMSMIYKAFQDRQVQIEPEVIEYLLRHLERSFKSIQTFIQIADMFSLSTKRALTIPLCRQVLEKLGQNQENLF